MCSSLAEKRRLPGHWKWVLGQICYLLPWLQGFSAADSEVCAVQLFPSSHGLLTECFLPDLRRRWRSRSSSSSSLSCLWECHPRPKPGSPLCVCPLTPTATWWARSVSHCSIFHYSQSLYRLPRNSRFIISCLDYSCSLLSVSLTQVLLKFIPPSLCPQYLQPWQCHLHSENLK